jgi:predicted RNA-binding Zn ribbon-like protein
MSDSKIQSTPTEPLLLADHLALDLLNTEAVSGSMRIDFWGDGDDVLRWLRRCGIDTGDLTDQVEKDALLAAAKHLRTVARELITLHKGGERGDPTHLNHYLASMQSVPVLEWNEGGPRLVRKVLTQLPTRALGRVAEAVADLLVDGQFDLVRQCEHPDCVLWFYDRTKSHRRRWCSMALCGNRHKAAEFRRRSTQASV